jgi:hypothetical protein
VAVVFLAALVSAGAAIAGTVSAAPISNDKARVWFFIYLILNLYFYNVS